MSKVPNDPLLQVETTCGSLLYELQVFPMTLWFIATQFLFPSLPGTNALFTFVSLLDTDLIIFLIYWQNQIIWDEVGESETERDKMLLELERECLEVYRRKVDQANRCRAQLRQAIADAEADLAAICSAMGERPVHIRQVSINWVNKDLDSSIVCRLYSQTSI